MRPFLLAVPALLALVSCQTAAPVPPDRFVQADTSKDGVLTGGEISDYFVTGIFTARDTNNDGGITAAEWNPEMSAADLKLFKIRDTNQDGAVSLTEAKVFAKKAGTYTAVVKEADLDKDGAVSREEAKAYYASKE